MASKPTTEKQARIIRELKRDRYASYRVIGIRAGGAHESTVRKTAKKNGMERIKGGKSSAVAVAADAVCDISNLHLEQEQDESDDIAEEEDLPPMDVRLGLVSDAMGISPPDRDLVDLMTSYYGYEEKLLDYAYGDNNRVKGIIAIMAAHENNMLREAVARTTQRSGLLAFLSQDKDSLVRKAVADNPSTPKDTLTNLAYDEDSVVREAVAKNFCAPDVALKVLLRDDNPSIRKGVAGNSSAGEEVVLKMLVNEEDDPDVLEALARRYETPEKYLVKLASLPIDEVMSVVLAAAGNTCTPQKSLSELVDSDITRIREAVAGNTSASQKDLEKLSKDKKTVVRSAVALNLRAPKNCLSRLVTDKSDLVRSAVASNSMASQQDLSILARDTSFTVRAAAACNSFIDEDDLRFLSDDNHENVIFEVAGNPSTPGDVLTKIFKTKGDDTAIGYQLANHYSAPEDILVELSKSEKKIVRDAASKTLYQTTMV